MNVGFVINDLGTEQATSSTLRLALAAARQGHEAWLWSVGDFFYAADGGIGAHARRIDAAASSPEAALEKLREESTSPQPTQLDDLDIVLLRNDPAADKTDRPWAQNAGALFGQLAVRRGVVVLNDPRTLASAIHKTYFQQFPRQVRPKTCISRNLGDIKRFIDEQGNNVVIKPLQGSGGQGVFLIRNGDSANVNQMIEAVLRDGYCIVQEYLPAAAEGDVRLFVMNGRPLEHQGKFAAFRRVNASGDVRSNMHAGGTSEGVEVTEQMLELVEIVRPKLVRDGIFLAGLDIVGDKLMEVNVFSPGGLISVQQASGIDFAEVIVADLARKARSRRVYGRNLSNVQIATM